MRHSEPDVACLRRDTLAALERLARADVRPVFWRILRRDTALWSTRVAVEHGLRLAGWTVDTHDWRDDRAEEMYDATRVEIEPGSIELAHDGIRPAARRHDDREDSGVRPAGGRSPSQETAAGGTGVNDAMIDAAPAPAALDAVLEARVGTER